ncbi:MAG TPA: phytanoyl-CoA dioxygenase family protein [Rhizomicrobium sp.]|jgi:ectoine hydroxylase-related dioxygenase (phytanoyl-CoA dioxygenase family)|nr:phytanoyl-CoA dioxygenase family protein [Rhizomicrobium sp.]
MRIIDRDGAVILSSVLDGAEVAAVTDELMPFLDATRAGREAFSGFKTTRTGALAARSPKVRKALLDSRIRAIADAVLLPNCERYQVNVTHIIRIMPGEVAQVMHKDRWSWQYLKGMEPQLNTIWALSDFTKDNGATLVAPGSQNWPDSRRPRPDEICAAEMERGSVLVYTGSVFHAGGANNTGAPRIGMNLTYCLGWLRQEENQYLSCPPDIACTFEPELQALMGYATGGYGLGFYTPPSLEDGPEVYPIEHAVQARS